MTVKVFNASLSEVSSPRPATARCLVEYTVDGRITITSTLGEDDTIHMLDKAMEAIDGQRLPPNGK